MTTNLAVEPSRRPSERVDGPSAKLTAWDIFRGDRLAVAGAVIVCIASLLVAIGPILSPETYTGFDFHSAGTHPGHGYRYLLGADVFGHSMMMWLLAGTRSSWGVPMGATLLALVFGWVTRQVSGLSQWVGELIGLVFELDMVIVFFPVTVMLEALVGQGDPWLAMLILSCVAGPYAAYSFLGAGSTPSHFQPPLVRLTLPAGYMSRSRAVATGGRLLATLFMMQLTVDYLGFGVQPPTASWGLALEEFPAYVSSGEWWWLGVPALAIIGTLAGLNFFIRGLTRALSTADGHPDAGLAI